MNSQFNQVAEFMRTFGQTTPHGASLPSSNTIQSRSNWLDEERNEILNAKDVIEYMDGVCDLLYVALGAAVEAGIDGSTLEKMFSEVHRSNMTKLWTHEEIQAVRFGENVTSLGDCSGGRFDGHYTVINTGISDEKRFVVKRSDGKVVKSPSWSRPNLEQFISGK